MLTKNNTYSILIVVLSVLLAISVIAGVTFAWFYSGDFASYRLTLGDPVTIKVIDRDNIPTDGVLDVSTSEQIGSGMLLPGKPIHMHARAMLDQSNTPAIIRARVEVEATSEGGELTQADINALNASLNASVTGLIGASNKWIYSENMVYRIEGGIETGELISDGGWWYYTNTNPHLTPHEDSELFRVISDTPVQNDRIIDFIVGTFNFPTSLDNKYANAEINFTVVFQALQGKIASTSDVPGEPEDPLSPYVGFIKNKVKDVQPIFHYAFGDGRVY